MTQKDSLKYFLYADDDSDDRETMIETIASLDPDLEVKGVVNGLAVLQFLNSLQPDAILPCFILLDVNMPQMDGFETLRFLKSSNHFRKIPVIMFSTSQSVSDRTLAETLGAELFITKPFSSKKILEITQEFANFCHEAPVERK